MRITTEVEVDVDPDDVLEEIDDETLRLEVEDRGLFKDNKPLLERVYEELRLSNAPTSPLLREYIYQVIGRVL